MQIYCMMFIELMKNIHVYIISRLFPGRHTWKQNAYSAVLIAIVISFSASGFCQNSTLEVEKIWKTPVDLTFSGYIEVNDEYTFKLQTNVPDTANGLKATQFLKAGDSIFGYEINAFVRKITEYETSDGRLMEKDISCLILKNSTGDTIKLQNNTTQRISEAMPVATLKNSEENLWPGKSFWINNKKFLVRHIDQNKIHLISDGDPIILEKGLGLDDPGSVLYFEYK